MKRLIFRSMLAFATMALYKKEHQDFFGYTKKNGEFVPPKFPKFTEAFNAGKANLLWDADSDFKCFYIEIDDPSLEELAVKEMRGWRVGSGRAYLRAHGITVTLEDVVVSLINSLDDADKPVDKAVVDKATDKDIKAPDVDEKKDDASAL